MMANSVSRRPTTDSHRTSTPERCSRIAATPSGRPVGEVIAAASYAFLTSGVSDARLIGGRRLRESGLMSLGSVPPAWGGAPSGRRLVTALGPEPTCAWRLIADG